MRVVDEAVRLLDRGSLQTARFLSRSPHARIGFAFYVLLIHLWVLVVLMHLAPGGRRPAISSLSHGAVRVRPG